MEQWNRVIAGLLNEVLEEVDARCYYYQIGEDVDGFYLRLKKKNNQFGKTIGNVIKKLRYRYQRECSSEDADAVALEMIIRVLFETYIGQLKHGIKDVNILTINSKDINEIKQALNNETDEEKWSRVTEFLKLFSKDNLDRYCKVLYNRAINKDYDENLMHLGGFQTTVKVTRRMENGKKVTDYQNIEYLSFDAPIKTSRDEELNTLDYLHNSNLELQMKCMDNVQNNNNETSGLYKYILENYYDKLTRKQKEFVSYALEQDEKFLVKGDDKYSRRSVYSLKAYIQDRIADQVRKDEKSKIFIANGKLQWKKDANIKDVLERILEQDSKDNQIDILISILSKDSKCMEVLVDYLLDVDLYQPCCQLIIGNMSKYRFKTLYLNKILKMFENYLKKEKDGR